MDKWFKDQLDMVGCQPIYVYLEFEPIAYSKHPNYQPSILIYCT